MVWIILLLMEKVLQILVVLLLLMMAINYYIKVEKGRFRLYRAVGRGLAPVDLLWRLTAVDPDNEVIFMAVNGGAAGGEGRVGRVEVLDSFSGEQLATVTVGADPGAQVFDLETKYLYSACGDGTLSIFRQVNKEFYRLQQTLATHPGCRVMALDPRTKKIYLPVTGTKPEMITDESGNEVVQPVDCWIYAHPL